EEEELIEILDTDDEVTKKRKELQIKFMNEQKLLKEKHSQEEKKLNDDIHDEYIKDVDYLHQSIQKVSNEHLEKLKEKIEDLISDTSLNENEKEKMIQSIEQEIQEFNKMLEKVKKAQENELLK